MVSVKYIVEVLRKLSKLNIQEAYQGNAIIEFYKSPNGKNYVQEFLDELEKINKTIAVAVYKDIKTLKQQGATAKAPLIDYLGNKIYELRTRVNSGQGNYWIRIFFFWDSGNKLVMTHGIKKKENKTPPEEIKKARKIRDKYFGNN